MDNIMGPELATETVKLFAQELKVVRAQLREAERRTSTSNTGGAEYTLAHETNQALIAENDALKADNAVLQERIARLQDELTQVSSIKSEEGLPIPLQCAEVPTSYMRGELARLLAENEDLLRGKKEVSRNQEKLAILHKKYTRSKAKVHDYNEILNELRVALSNCTEELEQSRKAAVSEIDFRVFLKDFPYEHVEGQSELSSSIQPYKRGVHTGLYEDVMGDCKGLYFISCNEVIWSPSGIALGLVVKPTFQYNPKNLGGAWTKLKDKFDVGRQMDVCCSSSKSSNIFHYLGTYERVGDQDMIIASESLKSLSHEKLHHASQSTTLYPDLVSPSQTRMVNNMYKQGVIKLQCFVIRCVAVNQTFTEKLRNKCTSSIQRDRSGDSPVTSGGVRKRKRDSKSTVHSTRGNKRKH